MSEDLELKYHENLDERNSFYKTILFPRVQNRKIKKIAVNVALSFVFMLFLCFSQRPGSQFDKTFLFLSIGFTIFYTFGLVLVVLKRHKKLKLPNRDFQHSFELTSEGCQFNVTHSQGSHSHTFPYSEVTEIGKTTSNGIFVMATSKLPGMKKAMKQYMLIYAEAFSQVDRDIYFEKLKETITENQKIKQSNPELNEQPV